MGVDCVDGIDVWLHRVNTQRSAQYTQHTTKSAGTHVPVSRHFIKRSGVQPQEAQEKHKRTEQNTKSTGSQYFKGSGPFDFFAP